MRRTVTLEAAWGQHINDFYTEVVAEVNRTEAMNQHDWHITITATDGSTMDLYARDVWVIEQAGLWPDDTVRGPLGACHVWTDDERVSHYCDDGDWDALHRCTCGQPAPTDDTLDMFAEAP